MTVATRNVSDMAHTGVPVVNPFAGGGRRQQTGKGGREKQGKEARPGGEGARPRPDPIHAQHKERKANTPPSPVRQFRLFFPDGNIYCTA